MCLIARSKARRQATANSIDPSLKCSSRPIFSGVAASGVGSGPLTESSPHAAAMPINSAQTAPTFQATFDLIDSMSSPFPSSLFICDGRSTSIRWKARLQGRSFRSGQPAEDVLQRLGGQLPG